MAAKCPPRSKRVYRTTLNRDSAYARGTRKISLWNTAAAVFPKEMFRIPEAYAKSRFNLVRYNRFDRGGHFAALEEPDLLVQDVQEFFRQLNLI